MKIRVIISILLCRALRTCLRLLGRGGTALPGKAALRVCPGLLGVVSRGVKTVVVTGTNGKTTTSRIIEKMLEDANMRCFANRSGSNLIQGITAEFVYHSTITGRPKYGYAVIECDEAASKSVCRYINPAVVLVTNVFRDQLDRYGEVLTTLENIKTGIKNSPNAVVCLNADCSMSASIAKDIGNRVIFYGIDTEIYKERVSEVSDASYCLYCKTEYEYDYVTYGHLGGFHCPNCGYKRPEAQVSVTKVICQTPDSSTVLMNVSGEEKEVLIAIPGGYNIYNAAAAVSVSNALGLPLETSVKSVGSFECGFGRMEKFLLDDHPVRMILVKNPAGCNQVLNFLSNMDQETFFACLLHDNDCDGTDVSWIWDVNFEKLRDMGDMLTGVVCSGTRAFDMALRLKYAGLPEEKITVAADYNKLLEKMLAQDKPVIIMPTYSGMMELRDKISKIYGYKEFWK